ncbi:tRNA(Ile)-lysidine synthase [Bacteroides sp. CAG:545]|nr:tRNA(Ile)-lysidine synthase [Bacteroides sp. CAG:545]
MMIQKSFDRTIVGLVPEKETALLAVSGGIDSICLASLFLNSSAGRRFAVAHCNFHLRGEDSDSDEALVAAWCGRNGVRYHKADFDTEQYASSHSVSIEMAARELRYDWFASLCRENGYYGVAVAHNANDNAETLILNLLRGTGMRGITGMQVESVVPVTRDELSGVRLLRPMLSFSRKQIEEYVAANSLEYHDDRTNAETVYKRNRIRHLVFPVFESLNPSFLTTFAREMNAFSEVQEIADDYFLSVRDGVCEPAGKDELLRVNAVRLCHLKHYKYVLYRLLEAYGFRDRLLEPVARLLESGKTFSGKIFEAPGYELITAGECLIVRKAARVVTESAVISELADAHGDRANVQSDLRGGVTVGTPVGVQVGKRGSVMVGKWGGAQNGAQVDKQGGAPGGAQVDEQGGEFSPVASENHVLGECFGLVGRDSASITSSFVGSGLSYSGLAGRVSARRSRGTLTIGGTVINENEACSVVRTTGEYVFDDFRVNVSVSEAGADPVADAKSLAREGIAAFSSEALTLPFLLRSWQNGDWMRPVGLNGKKKLSDIFTGLRLSIEEKSRALVIVLPGSACEGAGRGGSSSDVSDSGASDVSDSGASKKGADSIGTDAVRGVRVAGVCGYVSGRFFFRVDESVMVTPATASILKLYLRAPENV